MGTLIGDDEDVDDRAILDLSKRHYRSAGAHADAVRAEFGLSVTRYFQKLNRLLDGPRSARLLPCCRQQVASDADQIAAKPMLTGQHLIAFRLVVKWCEL